MLTTLANATQKKVQKLTSQMEELENRQRRSNLRLVGLPEGSENGDARTFLMTWLPKALDIETGQPLAIEQSYRLGTMLQQRYQTQDQVGSDKTRPRILLVKFLTYRDRDRVMKAARLKDAILVKERHVMFFPDLSTEVQKQYKLFDGVCAKCVRNMDSCSRQKCEFYTTKDGTTSPSQAEELIRKMKKVNTNQVVQKESPAETRQEGLSENFD